MKLNHIYHSDCLTGLKLLPDNSIDCCVTSPPYYALRSYLDEEHTDKALEVGSEESPQEYIDKMVQVFREVRRVLKPSGTCWINIGDSYAANRSYQVNGTKQTKNSQPRIGASVPTGFKSKDLMMIPHRVAIALQEDGWWVRSDLIWHKPACMPSSVRDRFTTDHEYVFLLTKSAQYYFDAEAVKEPAVSSEYDRTKRSKGRMTGTPSLVEGRKQAVAGDSLGIGTETRNKRTVMTVAYEVLKDAHYAAFPSKLIIPFVKSGSSEYGCCDKCGNPYQRIMEKTGEYLTGRGGSKKAVDNIIKYRGESGTYNSTFAEGKLNTYSTKGWEPTCNCQDGNLVPSVILDPFMGAGTTALVASKLGRKYVGFELNADYVKLANNRLERELGPLTAFFQ